MNPIEEFTDRIDFALVGPRDSRIHIARTRKYPFSNVCHLGRDFGGGRQSGCSGMIISPRLVLTAAHCLFSHRRGGAPRKIIVSPGRRDRDTFPFGRVVTTRYYVPRQYIQARGSSRQRKRFDYGVIVLSKPFNRLKRFPPLKALSDRDVRVLQSSGLVGVSGYPADRPVGTQWYHKERLKGASARRLRYTVDTCPGHSGSAVWTTSDGSPNVTVVGVHTSGILDAQGRSHGCKRGTTLAPSSMSNSGVRLTPAIVAALRRPSPARFRALNLVRP